MLALVVSVVFALYLFGPDALSRFILDFSVPRRVVTLTKSQEVYRAVVWSGGSLTIAVLWASASGVYKRLWVADRFEAFFSGVYSEQYFRENRKTWFESLYNVLWMNWAILWRLYVVLAILAVIVSLLVRFYGPIRHRLSGGGILQRFARFLLGAILLPRIAPWHVLLSGILLESRKTKIHIDVLTKMDVMYQGVFVEKTLAADGSLVSLTLARPRRFKREEFIEARRDAKGKIFHKTLEPQDFWKLIPTNIFVIMAAEIHSLNIRYLPEDISVMTRDSEDFRREMNALRERLTPRVNITIESK